MSRKRTEREKERQCEFGRRIEWLREEQGLTQGDVARMSGMDRSFISNLETGVYSIAAARLLDLATGLRIDTIDLFVEEHAVRNRNEVGSAPRCMELVDFICKEIASGLLRPGDFLARDAALCQLYGYSSFAVRKALAILRGRGLIRSWGEQHFVASPEDLKPIELGAGDRIVVRMPTPTQMFHYAIPEGVPVLICRRSGTARPDEIYQADRFYLLAGRTAQERGDAERAVRRSPERIETEGCDMTNFSDWRSEGHDFELAEMQRKVVAVAIETAEEALAVRKRDHGPHPDPSLRVRAIAQVVVHALNEYATEWHLDWTRKDWYNHQVETAIAALTANNNQLVHDMIAEVWTANRSPIGSSDQDTPQ